MMVSLHSYVEGEEEHSSFIFHCFMVQTCTEGLLVTCTNSHVAHYIDIPIIIYIVHSIEC